MPPPSITNLPLSSPSLPAHRPGEVALVLTTTTSDMGIHTPPYRELCVTPERSSNPLPATQSLQ
jgi:predicted molibdopterin-dependent oxidoreductase YjgC